MKYFLNTAVFVFCIFLVKGDKDSSIDGSFTKEFTRGNVHFYSELYQNGTREFEYKYFGKAYWLIVDVPSNVDGLEGIHVCSDIMLTMFLRDKDKNIWQCDFPGHFENPIKMACQELGKFNNTKCRDRHLRNPPIFMKNVEPQKVVDKASTNWTAILIAIIVVLTIILIFLLGCLAWKNFKKIRNIQNIFSKKSSKIEGQTDQRPPRPTRKKSSNEEIRMKLLIKKDTKPENVSEDVIVSPSTIPSSDTLVLESEIEQPNIRVTPNVDSIKISNNTSIPESQIKPSNIKTAANVDTSKINVQSRISQNRGPSPLPSHKNVSFQEDFVPLLDASNINNDHNNSLLSATEEIKEEPFEAMNIYENESNQPVANHFAEAKNRENINDNEYENVPRATSTSDSRIDETILTTDVAPEIAFNNLAKYIVSIGPKFVTIYDRFNGNNRSFTASVDYAKDEPEVGVEGLSSTVITANIYFDSPSDTFNTEELYEVNGTRKYFVLNIENKPKKINKNVVIVDILREVAKIIPTEALILTIPSHFNEALKTMFLEDARIAGFKDVQSLDENLALAYGIIKAYKIEESFMVINYSYCKTTMFKYDKQMLVLEIIEDVIPDLNEWYDQIIDEIDKGESPSNDVNFNYLYSIFDAVSIIKTKKAISMPNVFLIGTNPCYKLLQDKYSDKINLIKIEDSEKLVTDGIMTFCDLA